ncbi:MAG: FAD:protein FMN transferase [Candidatus Hinthialibacter antarcticus]|nr:FAD:protein FMN transferase [Candidatus Hinthialibacter antarcticus]
MTFQPGNNRRDFFRGSFDQFLNRVADVADIKRPLAFLGHNRKYTKMRRTIMATSFEVIYPSYEGIEARRAGMDILDEVGRFDRMLNIWKGESELKRVNNEAHLAPVEVSVELFRMLKLSKQLSEETGGAFDITTTPLTRCWGFFYRSGRLPEESEIAKALETVGMENVILDEEKHTVFFTKEGVELTPASIGKGFALDHASRIAKKKGLNDVLLNGGYSSVLASGAPEWKDCWQIDVRNPANHSQAAARLRLYNQGFSSSGAEEQHFEHEGKTYGHIVDPRTGWPAEQVMSVNVTAPTAAHAEALSTAFYVMGVEKTLDYCENHTQVGVVILTEPKNGSKGELITANLESKQLEVV